MECTLRGERSVEVHNRGKIVCKEIFYAMDEAQ